MCPKAFNAIQRLEPCMAVVTEGKLGAVIFFALIAGITIGLFVGYLIWVLRLFGCSWFAPC